MVVLYSESEVKSLVALFKLDLENYSTMSINFIGFLYFGGPKKVIDLQILDHSVEIVFFDYTIQSVSIFN